MTQKWVRVNLHLTQKTHAELKAWCIKQGKTLQDGLEWLVESAAHVTPTRQATVIPMRPARRPDVVQAFQTMYSREPDDAEYAKWDQAMRDSGPTEETM
jgi:hypothetical protein